MQCSPSTMFCIRAREHCTKNAEAVLLRAPDGQRSRHAVGSLSLSLTMRRPIFGSAPCRLPSRRRRLPFPVWHGHSAVAHSQRGSSAGMPRWSASASRLALVYPAAVTSMLSGPAPPRRPDTKRDRYCCASFKPSGRKHAELLHLVGVAAHPLLWSRRMVKRPSLGWMASVPFTAARRANRLSKKRCCTAPRRAPVAEDVQPAGQAVKRRRPLSRAFSTGKHRRRCTRPACLMLCGVGIPAVDTKPSGRRRDPRPPRRWK